MLGQIEDAINDPTRPLAEADQRRLDSAHRNAMRLLKLVNSLLDFSRIEAGRVRATYTATDLAAVTVELTSVFRSAVEKAGLTLSVDCAPLPEPVHVDPDMWEKIVLNLLSNAFKFTFAGGIAVRLRWHGGDAELTVSDTGTGVPPEHVSRLFERFHRVPNARGRTYEGSGIGLALVQELVKLHGGVIRVDSVLNEGTTFTVTIPRGTAHLPTDRSDGRGGLASTSIGARAFLEEALGWLPDGLTVEPQSASQPAAPRATADGPTDRARILWADDNADMRDYVRRLLIPYWEVQTVADGLQALEAARRAPPDLVLTDVMMPNLDGFGLLHALRSDPRTRTIPVIALSARAGEEARIEGGQAGADDYLVKPFSAKELLARVQVHLDLSRIRHEAAETERALRRAAEAELRHANRLSTMGETLAALAHDLNQPLAATINYIDGCEALFRAARPETLAIALGGLAKARDQAERAGTLVRHLRRFIRGGQAERQSTDFNALVREAAALALAGTERLGVRVLWDLAPEAKVSVDPVQIQQVVVNLIRNALDAMAGASRHDLTIATVVENEMVTLAVADTGTGLPADGADELFKPFITSKAAGLGLGLSICRSIAEAHGGRIWAEPNAGGGAVFRITLPQ